MMGKIFSRATYVHAWLGDIPGAVSLFIQAIQKAEQSSPQDGNLVYENKDLIDQTCM